MHLAHILPKNTEVGQSNTEQSRNALSFIGIGEEPTQESAIQAAYMMALERLEEHQEKNTGIITVIQSTSLSCTPVISGSAWNVTFQIFCYIKPKE